MESTWIQTVEGKIWHLLLLIVIVLTGGCGKTEFVTFKPVYRANDEFIVSEELIDDEFRSNIQFVFDYYEVPYKLDESGNILVPQSVWEDKDTMWNYTTKANDIDWIESRPDFEK